MHSRIPTAALSAAARPRRLAATMMLVAAIGSLACGPANAAVDLASGSDGGSAGASQRVRCSSLPELRHLALRVAILGDCEPTAAAAAPPSPAPAPPSSVLAQSIAASASSAPEGWIFQWKEDGAAAGAQAAELSTEACSEGAEPHSGRFNATCTHRYAAALPGFAARFQQRTQLAAFLEAYADQLQSAAPDTTVSLKRGVSLSGGEGSSGGGSSGSSGTAAAAGEAGAAVSAATLDSARWGLDRLDQPALPLDGRYEYWNTGTGVNVYILDTGIRASHMEFAYQDGQPGSRASEVFAAPSLDPALANQDCEGHGTHVAAVVGGLAFGVAKDVTLHAVRILDCHGNGAVSDVLLALDWLKLNAKRPAIVSMSLGGEVQLQLDEAVRSVAAEGIHVVVAAGNEDVDACDTSPAREASAVTVGASDVGDHRLWLSAGKGSNYGECVDIFAPGTDILSAAGSADNAQQLRTGTSQAVPFVAGVMALVLQNATGTTPADMHRLLINSAASGRLTEVAGSGFASLEAGGSPNLLLQSAIRAPIAVSAAGSAGGGGGAGAAVPLSIISSTATGPFSFSVVLTQRPTSAVDMQLTVDDSRGSLQPSSLQFTSDNWMKPQTVTLTVSPFSSTASSPVDVRIQSISADTLFQASQTALSLVDRKGDTLNYPKAVMSLPFTEQGSTGGSTPQEEGHYADDYGVSCGAADSDQGGAPDVVYYFKPTSDCTVTASLCGSSALADTFDSRLYLLADVDQGGALQAAACSNDACGVLPSLTVSLKAGIGYAFVVDGVGGAYGRYSISISAKEGAVSGELPPMSLQQASVSVASVGPAADSSGSTSPGISTEAATAGSSRYWLLGPWTACSSSCVQTRKVACYDSSGQALSNNECSTLTRPPSQQTCSSCGVQANSSAAEVAGSSGASAGSQGIPTTIIIAACAVGGALAVAAAAAGFLLVRRRGRQQQQAAAAAGHPQQQQHVQGKGATASGVGLPVGKWGSEEGGGHGELDCIPLPKSLRPIATGQGGGQPGGGPGAPAAARGRGTTPAGVASGTQHVAAAAGVAASAQQLRQQQQHHQQQPEVGTEAYAAAVAQLHSLVPEYHVVHMPSPRLPGQDTGSPSGVRRSLRQRSPTRRPREGARASPLAGEHPHRLARSSSGSHA